MALSNSDTGGTRPNYRRDFLASVVVFLVALPLCLGIAIASGVPPALGLIAGIIGGIVVGLLSGAPLQVSGPAAGLVSIVYEIVSTHGLEALGVVVLLAGLMQVVFGLLQWASFFRAVSPAVIHGMLAGIGVIIFSSQFHVMVDDKPTSNALTNLINIPSAVMKGIFPMDGTFHHLAAIIGVLTLLILGIWTILPKRFHIIPPALIAVVTCVIVADLMQWPIQHVSVPDQFLSAISLPGLPALAMLKSGDIWIAAVTIAFVATAETMLSTTALEQMHKGPRARYDKEIIAQGVGNTLSGLLGALPITGVIVRSTANIEAGATSRLSPVLHGIWLFGLIMVFPHLLEMIPIASLAAVLVYTGYKLLRPYVLKDLWKVGKGEAAISVITMAAVVSTNLLEGVLIGFGLSLLKLLWTLAHITIDVETTEDSELHVIMKGSATFINLPRMAAALEGLPPGRVVHVHADGLSYVDHACMELLTNWQKQYEHTGGKATVEWDSLPRTVRMLEASYSER